MTVAEMLERMSSRELSEWIAYAGLEPFGERQDAYYAAQICSMIANVNRDPKRHAKAYTPADFMANYDADVPEIDDSPEAWLAIKESMLLWNAALGGKDLRQ